MPTDMSLPFSGSATIKTHADESRARLQALVDSWGVSVDRVIRTANSLVALGHRGPQPVALKVSLRRDDERQSGAALDAFEGRGVVRVIEHADSAVLLERLVPGTSLATKVADDDRATAIIADVIQRMSSAAVPSTAVPVASLAEAFEQYLNGNARGIPDSLVRRAHQTYLQLCASQETPRLLHGDLHHYNVLFDQHRGWVAIDPKGLVGEPTYELGAALRNPCERPDVFSAPATIERRVHHFAHALGLDPERILAWAFAQAILAALWELEDDGLLTAGRSWVSLAMSIDAIRG